MLDIEGMAGVKRTRLADEGRVRRAESSACDSAVKFGPGGVEEDRSSEMVVSWRSLMMSLVLR